MLYGLTIRIATPPVFSWPICRIVYFRYEANLTDASSKNDVRRTKVENVLLKIVVGPTWCITGYSMHCSRSVVISVPVGCLMEERDKFWTALDEVVESIPKEEIVVIGADFNGHVGEGNRGDENVMGRYGYMARNAEGQMVVDFAAGMEMAVVNTYFKKREEHRVTYKSGGRSMQVE